MVPSTLGEGWHEVPGRGVFPPRSGRYGDPGVLSAAKRVGQGLLSAEIRDGYAWICVFDVLFVFDLFAALAS